LGKLECAKADLLFDISLQGGVCINGKRYPSLITDKIKLDVPIFFQNLILFLSRHSKRGKNLQKRKDSALDALERGICRGNARDEKRATRAKGLIQHPCMET
jgi:hypothetical protein